ncbi:hypothetical protein HY635_01855 [Candidatus Uhrbacteria bacterium]|nr:hypothetical protein [Candidatus Uhrbacteria bacterium]
MSSPLQQKPRQPRRSPSDHRYRLRIDTAGERGIVALVDRHQRTVATRAFSIDPPSPGALLRAIDALRRVRRLRINSLCGIEVVPGPGRFSRVRLGVVTANALAWALGAPLVVHGHRVRIAAPEYGAEPHIGGVDNDRTK